MIKERSVYIIMAGIIITFILYLFLDELISQDFKFLVFIIILIILEVSLFIIYSKFTKKKDKSEDTFDVLFEEK
ncbi:MAG: hypothetical protein KGD63_01310 [Candidatus Lokiarchaeota archaeon]|nr:hypothetical protein [Candidatus Lokiarchaeota archaeon]